MTVRLSGGWKETHTHTAHRGREKEREGGREEHIFIQTSVFFLPEPISAPRLTAAPHCSNWKEQNKPNTWLLLSSPASGSFSLLLLLFIFIFIFF